jgi:hypothetical protein
MKQPNQTNGRRRDASQPKPLKGLFFHSMKNGGLLWEGRILDQIDDYVLVMTHSALTGSEYCAHLVHISELAWNNETKSGFYLYDSRELFNFSCEHGAAHHALDRNRTAQRPRDTAKS